MPRSEPPPLSLYVHVPWCLRKCPYCDFNSHPLRTPIDETAFVGALLDDLENDLAETPCDRRPATLFIGGGTPSLLSADAVGRLLDGIDRRLPLAADAEITLEANPGTAEAARFRRYRQIGVNRLSIGVQSFDNDQLQRLGRVHDAAQASAAVRLAHAAGFDNFNLDLMYGLPGQDVDAAVVDLETALAFQPAHLSWYQLTLEPHTLFAARPPRLPDEDTLARIEAAGRQHLAAAGLVQYEVSAWSVAGRACRHNLNYWRFGDYLGIGPGAHGKLTVGDGRILRRAKLPAPRDYLEHAGSGRRLQRRTELAADEVGIEFMMNVLRLVEGVPEPHFPRCTGRDLSLLHAPLERARQRGLLRRDRLQATALGRRYLDDLVGLFA